MHKQVKPFIYSLKIAIVLFPLFFILDYFVYPEFKWPLLFIRLAITAFLILVLLSLQYFSHENKLRIITLSTVLASFSISLMCFITGDGFASPYYAGLLQILIITTLYQGFSPKRYGFTIFIIIFQHFVLQSFLPWEGKDLLINIFSLVIFSFIAVLVHLFVLKMTQENLVLKGLLPICSHCRDIKDDSGKWSDLERYLEKHSDLLFSHGICPDCTHELYKNEPWYDEQVLAEISDSK